MATKDLAQKFAEQALNVERIRGSHHVKGSVGRVVFVLAVADRSDGITQQELVQQTNLPKDVLSKLIKSLVNAGLLKQDREDYNGRIKKLTAAGPGKKLISEIKAALQPHQLAPKREPPTIERPRLWDIEVAK